MLVPDWGRGQVAWIWEQVGGVTLSPVGRIRQLDREEKGTQADVQERDPAGHSVRSAKSRAVWEQTLEDACWGLEGTELCSGAKLPGQICCSSSFKCNPEADGRGRGQTWWPACLGLAVRCAIVDSR